MCVSEDVSNQIMLLLNTHNQLTEPVTSVKLERYMRIGTTGFETSVWACAEYCKRTFFMAEIRHVVTHPDHRRKGYARILIESCIRKCFTDGVMFVVMTTRSDNEAMIALLSSLSFHRFRTRMNPTSGHDIIIWIKEIV